MPAAPLLGAALAVAAAVVLQLRAAVPTWLRNLAYVVVGISLGAGIRARVFSRLPDWSISLALLLATVVLTILCSALLLGRAYRIDRRTAVLASSPGSMTSALAIALDGFGDVGAVTFIQILRLFLLVTTAPLIATGIGATDVSTATQAAGTAAPVMQIQPLAGLLAVAILVGLAGQRAGVPAAFLVAGLAVSAVAHVTGLSAGQAPGWVLAGAFTVTGATLGTRLGTVPRASFARLTAPAFASVLVAIAVSGAIASVTTYLTGLDFAQVWIAFAPGGVEAMAVIGLSLGYDPMYIALHHLVRLLFLAVLLPLLVVRH